MNTHFAPPEKADEKDLSAHISVVSGSLLVSELLNSISGLLAILNEHRQIISLNESFLKLIGIDNPEEALGLRPGEVLNCIHSHEEPGGCGTARACATCGAAVAILASLKQDRPVEKVCTLSARKKGQPVDLVMIVRSQPIVIANHKILLLFLQDITRQQQQAALEKAFFHDINNMLMSLQGAAEMLEEEHPSELSHVIGQVVMRLNSEVAIQRSLSIENTGLYKPFWHSYEVERIMDEWRKALINHPAAKAKNIDFPKEPHTLKIRTDISLLLRILGNMGINALEATPAGGTVRVWTEQQDRLSFCVWNQKVIPEHISVRIFQRNFSTKDKLGRGVGTYSMKLFGEEIMGGRVSFTSSDDEGTVFRFSVDT